METDIHQQLMDSAYKKYGNLSTSDWYGILTPNEKKAVILGNFNYQVCNGGVQQWIGNGYCLDIEFLISTLNKIGTDSCKKIVEFLNVVLPEIDLNAKRQGAMGNYMKDKSEDAEFNFDSEEFEDEFYSGLSDKFLSDCNEFFRKNENE